MLGRINGDLETTARTCFPPEINISMSLEAAMLRYSSIMATINSEEHPRMGPGRGRLEGKVALIVNTASKCGFTPQYEGLEKLHAKYADQGLVVLGFPCNQFGAQEPGSAEEISGFCQKNYGVSFPMHEKIEVNGDGTHPVYSFLKGEKPGFLGTEKIKWNFTKFLVDKQGKYAEATPYVKELLNSVLGGYMPHNLMNAVWGSESLAKQQLTELYETCQKAEKKSQKTGRGKKKGRKNNTWSGRRGGSGGGGEGGGDGGGEGGGEGGGG